MSLVIRRSVTMTQVLEDLAENSVSQIENLNISSLASTENVHCNKFWGLKGCGEN